MDEWQEWQIALLKTKCNDFDSHQIAELLDKSPDAIRSKARRLGIVCKAKQRTQTPVNHNFFASWSVEMAYVLGYWFADGCISQGMDYLYRFELTSKDSDHLVMVRHLMDSLHSILDKHDGSYRLFIGSKTIWQDVQKLGGVPGKSLIARFPEVPTQYIRDFCRGYFDGDGSVRIQKHHYPTAKFLGTYEFLNGLLGHLPERVPLYHRREGNQYQIHFSGERAQNVLSWMYSNASVYLQRKYRMYQLSLLWKPTRLAKGKGAR